MLSGQLPQPTAGERLLGLSRIGRWILEFLLMTLVHICSYNIYIYKHIHTYILLIHCLSCLSDFFRVRFHKTDFEKSAWCHEAAESSEGQGWFFGFSCSLRLCAGRAQWIRHLRASGSLGGRGQWVGKNGAWFDRWAASMLATLQWREHSMVETKCTTSDVARGERP